MTIVPTPRSDAAKRFERRARNNPLHRHGRSVPPALGRHPLVILGILCLVLEPSTAFAAMGEELIPNQWYLGIGAVYAIQNMDVNKSSFDGYVGGPSSIDFDNSAGANLTIGRRLMPHLALEVYYQWLEGFDSTNGNPAVELDTHFVSFNARLYPLEKGRLQPYVMLGVGALVVNTEIFTDAVDKPYDIDVGYTTLFGGGLEYYMGDHWVFGMEGNYLLPTGDVEDNDYASIVWSFKYRF